jgi:hypothetical protein
MENFRAALAAVEEMKRDGVIVEYAVGGAMAMIFWAEPIATFDLDVFAVLPSAGLLISLEPIYQWARQRGYTERAEHIEMEGVPVQIIPAHNALTEEAVATATTVDYEGVPVRVIRPEYLAAMALDGSARTPARMQRVLAMLQSGAADRELLDALARKYKLRLPDLS